MRYLNILPVLLIAVLPACSTMDNLRDPAYAPATPLPLPPRTEANGSIYHDNTNRFLFEDIKARRVGDTITVLLEEATDASKSATSSASKNTKFDTGVPTVFGKGVTKDGRDVLVMDVDSEFDFSGKGDTTQSNSLTGSITVTVTEVLSNGNLRIRGEKLLTLNQGSEVVRIDGLIRANDISPQNTIASTQIAGAEITYSGNGFIADGSKPGWFTRFFKVIWPF